MTPDEFRATRKKLGLSASKMAAALGLADGRIIRRYERGDVPVTGPVARLTAILADPRCPDWCRER